MKPLRNAVEDYIALRRSLGFKLRDTATCLTEFAAFLEEKQAPYITTALALEWAMQPVNHQPSDWARRLGFVRVFARHWSATDPRTEIPAAGLLPFRARRAHSLSVHRGGDSKTAGCRQEPFTRGRPSTSDLSLFIWVVSSQWAPHQRGNQIRAARRGFRPRTPHHSPSQVQQDPFDSAPYFHPGGLYPIRRTS
jgi:hypothetical protein